MRFFASGFFSLINFPQAPQNDIRTLTNLLKISRDIRKSRYITYIKDTINFPTGTAGVVDTGGKFGVDGGPQISSANSNSDLQNL
jgi:hypothetical protein